MEDANAYPTNNHNRHNHKGFSIKELPKIPFPGITQYSLLMLFSHRSKNHELKYEKHKH